MTDMKYLDFDVAIEPAADGYTARVFNSPVGQAAGAFVAPFSDLEIENFLLRVGRSRHAVRRIESPEMASAKAFGGRLFDHVFAGEVRGCLRSSIDEASRQGTGLRVRLHLTKVPALADLPWEFLYNASMNRFLSLSVDTPLVRYLELPERIRPLAVQPPLRVLMMISSPSDYPQLDVDRESKNMSDALADLERRGLVTVDRQEDATLAELQRRLRSGHYHIFHFVGHGGFDAQADDGVLIMEDQDNRGRRVSAQFLGTLLHDHRPLRLAVLNACEGARASRGDPFAGTAQSLVQQGIPAVIAMQFEVTDEAAICFTREFYAAIAVGYPVDAALAEARKAIFAEVSEIEWGTPVLYMRSPDGRVFEIEQVSDATRRQLQVSSLITTARTAVASNDTTTALETLNELLTLEPEHGEAVALLREITREKERAEEKERADRERLERERLEAERADRERIERERIERERADAEREARRRRKAQVTPRNQPSTAADAASAAAGPAAASARRQPMRWFVAGGALGAAAAVVVFVAALAAIGLYMGNRATEPGTSAAVPAPSSPQPAAPSPTPIDPPRQDVRTPRIDPAPVAPQPRRAIQTLPPATTTVPSVKADVEPPAAARTDDVKANLPAAVVVPPPAPVSPVVRTVTPAPAEDPPIVTPQLRDVLAATIRRAAEIEVGAFSTMNPALLARSYSGALLTKQVEEMRTMAANQVFGISRLHDQRFESFSVSRDGRRAEVRLREVWSTNFHSTSTRQCVSHIHEREIPQTLSLELTDHGWMIDAAEFHGDTTPRIVACH